jgi:hypothetical protein
VTCGAKKEYSLFCWVCPLEVSPFWSEALTLQLQGSRASQSLVTMFPVSGLHPHLILNLRYGF